MPVTAWTLRVQNGVCKVCGKPWESVCRKKKYCSDTCRLIEQRAMAKKLKAKRKKKA